MSGGGPEVRLAEALRARAAGAVGRPRGDRPPWSAGLVLVLVLVLLGGAVLGVGLGLLSVLAPGTLPVLG